MSTDIKSVFHTCGPNHDRDLQGAREQEHGSKLLIACSDRRSLPAADVRGSRCAQSITPSGQLHRGCSVEA